MDGEGSVVRVVCLRRGLRGLGRIKIYTSLYEKVVKDKISVPDIIGVETEPLRVIEDPRSRKER